ncbi:hypothetical protein KFU94_23530 [Chloroflexi bacterium TSY]|nr:hypothetical protein [Chloroflexi bacterium TSY]
MYGILGHTGIGLMTAIQDRHCVAGGHGPHIRTHFLDDTAGHIEQFALLVAVLVQIGAHIAAGAEGRVGNLDHDLTGTGGGYRFVYHFDLPVTGKIIVLHGLSPFIADYTHFIK